MHWSSDHLPIYIFVWYLYAARQSNEFPLHGNDDSHIVSPHWRLNKNIHYPFGCNKQIKHWIGTTISIYRYQTILNMRFDSFAHIYFITACRAPINRIEENITMYKVDVVYVASIDVNYYHKMTQSRSIIMKRWKHPSTSQHNECVLVLAWMVDNSCEIYLSLSADSSSCIKHTFSSHLYFISNIYNKNCLLPLNAQLLMFNFFHLLLLRCLSLQSKYANHYVAFGIVFDISSCAIWHLPFVKHLRQRSSSVATNYVFGESLTTGKALHVIDLFAIQNETIIWLLHLANWLSDQQAGSNGVPFVWCGVKQLSRN